MSDQKQSPKSDVQTDVLSKLKELVEKQKSLQANHRAKQLDTWFIYHSPTPDDVKKYAKINEAAKAFAKIVMDECIEGKDQDTALLLIRQARMTANSSIACKGV
jgi:hypothetical protein